MVCCVKIAALLGLILRPVAGRRASPLAWRPDTTDAAADVSWAGGRLRSFTFAFAGIGFLLRAEPNMRIHLAAATVVVLAAAAVLIAAFAALLIGASVFWSVFARPAPHSHIVYLRWLTGPKEGVASRRNSRPSNSLATCLKAASRSAERRQAETSY